ncbi:MAG TPA: YqgE/AlgH family protein [Stellaceae bacterium]|nr:YqgE/AlgH family protein [Stellaceae bacterium]
MAKIGIGRATLAASGLIAAMLALGAVEPGVPSGETPPVTTPAADPPPGDLLIASAQIQDPRFRRTVILILRHDKDGAVGIVVNRPVGEHPIAELLEAAGDKDSGAEGSIRVFEGGPVQQQLGFVVHSADYRRADTVAVDGKVAMTASKEALRDIGRHRGPKQCFFAFGYAGWAAGQLEGEIARRDWFTIPEDLSLVFDADRDTVWDRALARRGQDL